MKRLAVSVVIFSLVVIVSGLSFAQNTGPASPMTRPHIERMHKAGIGMHHESILKKLNLTDQQKQKIAELKITFQKKMADMKADLQKSKLDLKELRVKGDFSRPDVIAAVKNVNQSKNAIAIAVANHMLDVYEVLTPEQQKIWKENAPMMNNRTHRGWRMMQHKWMSR